MSHHYNHQNPSSQDIKRQLERIKETQAEVLRDLRKQQSILVIGNSKSDSFQARQVKGHDSNAVDALYRERIKQLQSEILVYMNKEKRARQQNFRISQMLAKNQQKRSELERLLKMLQNNENENLAKAQQALKNAIDSEKRYINLKFQYDQVCQANQGVRSDLKNLQDKHIHKIIQGQDEICGQIAKDVACLNEAHQKIYELSSKSGRKNAIRAEFQMEFEKYYNRILIRLSNAEELFPHPGNIHSDQNYMSGSFQQDMHIIQEQLNKGQNYQKQKISQLQNQVSRINRLNIQLKKQIQQNQEETQIIRIQFRTQAREIEEWKLGKRIVQEEYEDFKKRVIQKNRQRQSESPQKLSSLRADSKRQRQTIEIKRQIERQCSEIIEKMEEKLQTKNEQIQRIRNSSKQQQKIIEKLKNEIQLVQDQRRHEKQQHQFQLSRINSEINQISQVNLKDQSEWRDMLEMVKRLQTERISLLKSQQQSQSKIKEMQKYKQNDVLRLNSTIQQMQGVIQDLRKENSVINYERSELIRLRKKVDQKSDHIVYDKIVDQLWGLKQFQYDGVNKLLTSIIKVPAKKVIRMEPPRPR